MRGMGRPLFLPVSERILGASPARLRGRRSGTATRTRNAESGAERGLDRVGVLCAQAGA